MSLEVFRVVNSNLVELAMKQSNSREGTVFIELVEIHMSAREKDKLLRKDRNRLDGMRAQIEAGEQMVPIEVHEVDPVGYSIWDGKHRFLAHELAGETVIEAVVLRQASRKGR